jgi:hypothetical protein
VSGGITARLRRPLEVRVDLRAVLAGSWGRRTAAEIAGQPVRPRGEDSVPLGDLFELAGEPEGRIRFQGDLALADRLGAGLSEGEVIVEGLRPFSGQDAAVADYFAGDAGFAPFFDHLTAMLEGLLPRYEREGKSYLTIALGCTGGRHRSVFVAERLAAWLRERGRAVHLAHRDIARDPARVAGAQ